MITDSKAIEAKAHELELIKASNIAIEKRMEEDKKAVAELDSKRKNLDQELSESAARLSWE